MKNNEKKKLTIQKYIKKNIYIKTYKKYKKIII